MFVKLPPKAAVFQRNYFLKLFRNACQNYFPKRIAKNVSQSSSLKRLCKAVTSKQLHQSGHVSNLFPKAATQSYSPKRLPKPLHKVVAESCSPKFRSKANSQNCGSLKLLFKAAVQSCGAKLLFKAAPASQSCSAKLLPKAVPCSCFPEVMPKAPPQSECPKVTMLQRYFPKRFPSKAAPRNCSAKLLPTTAPQSCILKLVAKAAPHGYGFSKLLLEAAKLLLLPKDVPQSCSPKLISKAIPNSCFPILQTQKLLLKAPPRSCL